jgi:DNA-binding CsgD family transcriptional regulator
MLQHSGEIGQFPTTLHRDQVDLLSSLPGIQVVARDASWRLMWCNEAFATGVASSLSSLVGTTWERIMPMRTAHAHVDLLKDVTEQHAPIRYWQLWHGRRTLRMAWHAPAHLFGKDGFVAAIVTVPAGMQLQGVSVCRGALLGPLAPLTNAELHVAYHFARGQGPTEIAQELARSEHTILDHLKSIYAKLKIKRQASLSSLLASLDISGFSPDDWNRLVVGRAA